MAPEVVGIICIAILLGLMVLGVNIAVALALVGVLGIGIIAGSQAGFSVVGVVTFRSVAVFSFVALPLFLLMGEFAYEAGLVGDIFKAANKWLGALPGGMGMAVITACAGFGTISGSGVVAAAAMTRVCWPELMKLRYDRGLAAGLLASGGGLAVLIPPSMLAVLYGMFTQTSIGQVLLAGVIPGIITATLLMTLIYTRARLQPQVAPRAPRVPMREKFGSLKAIWSVILLALIVTGGMYAGFFTATEAAAAGAFGAFAIALAMRRMSWTMFKSSLAQTAKTTSFIFLILIGAFVFSRLLVLSNISPSITDAIGGWQVPRVFVLIGILSLYVMLGMFMDATAMLAVSISTVFPIVTSLGYNPVWFGTVFIMMVEVGGITPPVGLGVFAVKGILGDQIQTWSIFKNAQQFLFCYVVMITLLIIFPQLALWIPMNMEG
ncbi:MAG: TRAP transporter large permease [Chloroflexi bacterium]|nr:TRAP transporter large permease [Chloroflexota bacterium]